MLRQTIQTNLITTRYASLSKNDYQTRDSISIVHQKRILKTCAQENGFMNYHFFVTMTEMVQT